MHPTYSLFLLVPLVGFALARLLLARRDGRELALALGGLRAPDRGRRGRARADRADGGLVPARRGRLEGARHGLERYGSQLDVFSDSLYRVAPEVVSRSGAVAVAALLLVPLAALAAPRRWAAFVLGGTVAVLALVLVPFLFAPFAELVSLSQARRAAGFVPFAFAFAGGFSVLARWAGVASRRSRSRPGSRPAPLAGRLRLRARGGRPGLGDLDRSGRRCRGARRGRGVAATHPVRAAWPARLRLGAPVRLPVAVHAAWNWDEREPVRPPLPQALVDELPEGAVVLSDLETSYRLLAQAPVYVVAAPPAHVADTEKNRPYYRKALVNRFLRTGDLAIARNSGAGWILVDRRHFDPPLSLYRDGRYALFRVE